MIINFTARAYVFDEGVSHLRTERHLTIKKELVNDLGHTYYCEVVDNPIPFGPDPFMSYKKYDYATRPGDNFIEASTLQFHRADVAKTGTNKVTLCAASEDWASKDNITKVVSHGELSDNGIYYGHMNFVERVKAACADLILQMETMGTKEAGVVDPPVADANDGL